MFIGRHVNLSFQLGEGNFGEDGKDTVDFTGLRVSATVTREGGQSLATAEIRASGMPLDVMNKLSILGKPLVGVRANFVTITAFDTGGSPVEVFTGAINEAWIDGRNAPEMTFTLSAFDGLVEAIKPAAPTSYKGNVDLALVTENIVKQMGKTLENSGVSVQSSNVYLHGTLMTQLRDVAREGNFNCEVDGDIVAIWPADGVRGGQPAVISAETGMVGYPTISEGGVDLVTLFNPLVAIGRPVEVKSLFERANGQWVVYSIIHNLESETVGGKWFTTISGRLFDHTETTPA